MTPETFRMDDIVFLRPRRASRFPRWAGPLRIEEVPSEDRLYVIVRNAAGIRGGFFPHELQLRADADDNEAVE